MISMSIYPKSSPHLNAFQPKFYIYFSSALNKCALPASVIILTILGKEYNIWYASLHNSFVPLSLGFPHNDNLLTAWSRVLIEYVTIPHEVKEFPHFMETETSSLHLQGPANSNPVPSLINPSMHPTLPETNYLKICFNITLPSMHTHTSLFLIWLLKYMVRSTGHKAPHYTVPSSPLLPCPS
jgi:hypothetical protein